MTDSYLDLFKAINAKQAVVAAPAGQVQPPPPPPGQPPMDPAMMGAAPPMDPAMMDPAMMGAAPPMDPAMMGAAPPMDPAMMDPAMMGATPPMDIQTEISDIKAMLQQLMDAQVAMMQALAPPDMGGGAMPSAGPEGLPTDAAMMPPPGINGGVDPSMMGLPASSPTGMIAQAAYDEENEFNNYIKSITDLLR